MVRQHHRRGQSRNVPAFRSAVGPTAVLAVSNSQRFIEQISNLLSDEVRLKMVGGAQDRVQAAERLVLLKPDVVVIEANLDYELGGIDTAFALRSICPTTSFVLVSPYADPERLAMVPRGLGLEWSYLLSFGEIKKDDLVSAINSAAWSIPFIDERIDRSQLGALQVRVESTVDRVLRRAKQARKHAGNTNRPKLGYAGSAEWNGKVQKFRIEDLPEAPEGEK